MTIEISQAELDAKLAAAADAGRKEVEAELAAKAAREKEIKDAEEAAAAKAREEFEEEHKEELELAAKAKKDAEEAAAKGRRLEDEGDEEEGGAPNVAKYGNTWKYDNLDNGALALTVGVLSRAKAVGQSEHGISENAIKALAIRMVTDKDPKRQNVRTLMAMKAAKMPLKANELNQSTLASYGDEWVGVEYSNQLWEKIRVGTPIVGMIPTVEVPQGAESIVIPLQSTAPTFYKVAQASALDGASALGHVTPTVPASKMGTDKQTLSVGKMGARTIYTGELEEDSFIPWASELRDALVQEGQETLEHIVIDGDTATGATTNINDIAGTPAGTEAFLLFNGFRKLPLVTATGNLRDGAGFTVEDYLETIKLMGLSGRNARDKSKVIFIQDMGVSWAALELSEVKTHDVFVRPTLENGELSAIWGYKVFTSGNMHRANQDATYGLKANAAGKIDLDTASNNTRGALLAVRLDQWRLGFKRRMTLETTRIPNADATEIVALSRVGMVNRDDEASAISYNLSV